MKRLAVFRGVVYMGARRCEAGEHWVRPQDVQALIESGVVRWADDPVPASWADDGGAQSTTKARIWRLTVPEARGDIQIEKSPQRLRRWHDEEQRNPSYDGGRAGVLDALEERLGEVRFAGTPPTGSA